MKSGVAFSMAALLAVSGAAPVQQQQARPHEARSEVRLPRDDGRPGSETNILNVLPHDVTDTTGKIVDSLPVDASVSAPVLPGQKRDAAVAVDLGGADLTLKRGESSSDNNIADILPDGLQDTINKIVDSLPADCKVNLPVLPGQKREAAIAVDLGGADLTLKRDAAIAVDLGGADLTLKRGESSSDNNIADILPDGLQDTINKIVDSLPADCKVNLPVLPGQKRDAAIEVDLGGAGVTV